MALIQGMPKATILFQQVVSRNHFDIASTINKKKKEENVGKATKFVLESRKLVEEEP